MLLLNDSKCISLISKQYDLPSRLCQLGNIINFEYSENFPNSGFTSLIFPIGKALGPLPKIAKKIPATIKTSFTKMISKIQFLKKLRFSIVISEYAVKYFGLTVLSGH